MNPADRNRLLARFNGNPPAEAATIGRFETISKIILPDEYARFLQQNDGGEGFVGNAYIILWKVGELLEMNKAYRVSEYVPGLFLFGSDGGSEAFAFDIQTDVGKIFSVPFVGMELELAMPIAPDFDTFLEKLYIK